MASRRALTCAAESAARFSRGTLRQPAGRPPAQGPRAERLEPRRLLAAIAWDGGGDGVSWSMGLNWSPNRVPGPGDDVTIDVAGNPVIRITTGAPTANSILLRESLQITGGSLLVGGMFRVEPGGDLVVDAGRLEAGSLELSEAPVTINGGDVAAVQLEVLADAILTLNTAATFGQGHIANGGVITHAPADDGFSMMVNGDLTVDAGGAIKADGLGFSWGNGDGTTDAIHVDRISAGAGGAGYGGKGGDAASRGGPPYGSATNPVHLGSGGGSLTWPLDGGARIWVYGGAGGGKVELDVGGRLTLHGSISASGAVGGADGLLTGVIWSGGGGSGGTVKIRADVIAGAGTVSANGGNAGNAKVGGGGGGGRIALYYRAYEFDDGRFNVNGGQGNRSGDLGSLEAIELPPLAPLVANVYVSGSAWTTDFKRYLQAKGLGNRNDGYLIPDTDQLNELPWVNLDRVSVRFSTNVKVDPNDLRVRGVAVADYAFHGPAFAYNPLTRTATWTLPAGQTFDRDRLTLDLDADAPDGVRTASGTAVDGDWINPVGEAAGGDRFPSGNNTPGGDFRFRLNVLAGDTERDGSVLARDYAEVKKRFFSSTQNENAGSTPYSVFYDTDGSGTTLAFDYAEVKKRFFNTLPDPQPAAAPAAMARLTPRARRAEPWETDTDLLA